jgi:hypothetical protein
MPKRKSYKVARIPVPAFWLNRGGELRVSKGDLDSLLAGNIETEEVKLHLRDCFANGRPMGNSLPKPEVLGWTLKPSKAKSGFDFVVRYEVKWVHYKYAEDNDPVMVSLALQETLS